MSEQIVHIYNYFAFAIFGWKRFVEHVSIDIHDQCASCVCIVSANKEQREQTKKIDIQLKSPFQ